MAVVTGVRVDGAVELADMIAQLRTELSKAMTEGNGKELRFQAERVEVELTVVVERSHEPGVKAKLWVLEAGHAARLAQAATQRVLLSLQPVLEDTPDRPALISGPELDNEK